jgi:antirestriction protein ArdC
MNNQYNAISRLVYEGHNQAYLQSAKAKAGYKSDEWLTFLQARELKLKVIKGSKSMTIFRGFSKVETKTRDGQLRVDSVPLGFAYVFNIEQTEKIEK